MSDGKGIDGIAKALQKVTIDSNDGMNQVELAPVEESLSPEERVVVGTLKELQAQHYEVNARFEEEVMELKMKYEKLYAPFYTKRREALLSKTTSTEVDSKSEKVGTPALRGFWFRALKNNRLLGDLIEEVDEELLMALKDIRCEYLTPKEQQVVETKAAAVTGKATESMLVKNPESFRLVFEFEDNEYFTNQFLVKEYHLTTSSEGKGGAELTSTYSTPIDWKASKDITKKTVVRKQRNRKTKQTRSVVETVDAESFFNLFTDHEIPSDEMLEQMSDKEVQELQVVVEADYDIGITIRDKILPRAVEWFLGEAEDDSDYDDYDDDDGAFDSDDDDDEDDSTDEDIKGKRR